MRFCPDCGAHNEDAYRFCRNCGTVLPEASTALPASVISSLPNSEHPAEAFGKVCPSCGRHYGADDRFCEIDGTPLPSSAATELSDSPPPVGVRQPVVAADPPRPVAALTNQNEGLDYVDPEFSGRRPWLKVILAIAVLLILCGGGYYALKSGLLGTTLSEWIHWPHLRRGGAPATPTAGSGVAAGAKITLGAPAPNAMPDTYRAHLYDQDVTLVFPHVDGTKAPRSGTISYHNTVNGSQCSATVTPLNASGVAADGFTAYRQVPLLNQPACPRNINLRINFGDQPMAAHRMTNTLKAEWTDPATDKLLMSGTLNRDVQQ